MGSTILNNRISEQEYLQNPAYERYEYFGAEAHAINVGNKRHARAQIRMGAALIGYFQSNNSGDAFTEFRCRLRVGDESRFYLPDVAVVIGGRIVGEDFLDGAPDLAIEIRSPDDTLASLIRKAQDYLAAGSRTVWLVLPEEQSILVMDGKEVRTYSKSEVLKDENLLPGFELAIESIF